MVCKVRNAIVTENVCWEYNKNTMFERWKYGDLNKEVHDDIDFRNTLVFNNYGLKSKQKIYVSVYTKTLRA